MPGGAAAGWVLGVSPLSIPTWVRELAGAVAGFIPARRQWLRIHGTRLCTGGCDSQAVLIHSLDELSHQNHACVSSDSDDDPRTKSLPGRRWPHAPLFYAASQSTYRISSSCPPQSDGWAGRAKSSLKSSLHNINSWYCLRLCLLFVSLCLPQRPVRDLWGTNNKE